MPNLSWFPCGPLPAERTVRHPEIKGAWVAMKGPRGALQPIVVYVRTRKPRRESAERVFGYDENRFPLKASDWDGKRVVGERMQCSVAEYEVVKLTPAQKRRLAKLINGK